MIMWGGLMFQDSGSYLMEQLVFFHDHSMVILVFVNVLVLYFSVISFFMVRFDSSITEGHEIEFFWTIAPAILLCFVALPSLKILYLIDEALGTSITFKVTGHQWFWSYEYSDFFSMDFDSYMNSSVIFRLMDSDERLYAPFSVPLRFLLTSLDVIHSWTIPSMGVKSDALPGRLNQINFLISRPGLYFGQCSELCGVNHSFMPIVLESTEPSVFLSYFY